MPTDVIVLRGKSNPISNWRNYLSCVSCRYLCPRFFNLICVQVLTEKHMLTAAEEWDLVEQLHFAPEDAWLQTLYRWVSANRP